MFKKVAFTMYPIEDADRARSFYENVLGLKRGSGGPQGTWTEYDLPGGGCLALYKTKDIKPSTEAGGCIAFEVEDLDQLNQQLRQKGVEFKVAMIDTHVCRSSIIKDSEGNPIILHQLKNPQG